MTTTAGDRTDGNRTARDAEPVARTRPRLLGRPIAGWHLFAALSGVAALSLAAGPVTDPDVYWHVHVGELLLRLHHFPVPDPWSYTLPLAHWHSTAWLSEVVLAAVHRWAGFGGVVALRLTLTVAVLAMLARELLPRRTPWVGALVFAITAIPLAPYIQDRPQTVSFLFVIWLSRVADRARREQLPPRWPVVAGWTWLWANFHGYWVLAPVALLLVAAGNLVDTGAPARRSARATAVAGLAALLAAAATPLGPRLLATPFTVSGSAGSIAEWAHSRPVEPPSWGLLSLLVVLAVCWSRSHRPVPRSELLWVLAWTAFSLLAIRNQAPAALLVAPVAVRRLEESYGGARPGPRLPAWSLLVVAVAAVATVLPGQLRAPSVPTTFPAGIAARLASTPQPLRVLNDYNISGFLIDATHGRARLAIDGRSDRYGAAFIAHYGSAVAGEPGWQDTVSGLGPQVAVLRRTAPLAGLLADQLGWHVVLRDHAFLLLAPPGPPPS